MTTTAQPRHGDFPQKLEQVEQSERVSESFSFGFVAYGILALAVLLSALLWPDVFSWRKDSSATSVIAALAVGGVALIAIEFWRRSRRTVLVRHNAQYAVYRKGALDGVFTIGQVTHWKFRQGRTIVYAIAVICAPGMPIAAVYDSSLTLDDRWQMVVFGIALMIFFLNEIHSRAALAHFLIPKPGRMGSETVRLTRGQARRMF